MNSSKFVQIKANTIAGSHFRDDFTGVGTPGPDTLTGTSGDDTLEGGDGDDVLVAGGRGDGFDLYDGGSGVDVIETSKILQVRDIEGVERIEVADGGVELVFDGRTEFGYSLDLRAVDTTNLLVIRTGAVPSGRYELYDNDDTHMIFGGDGRDELYGLGGDDTLDGGANHDGLYAGDGDDWVFGGDGDDAIDGADGNDVIAGGRGYDALLGGQGDDYLDGGDQDDWLLAGGGADTMVGGGGADLFVFESAYSSGGVIADFSQAESDRIDLRGLGFPGDPLVFIGAQAFTGVAGELRFDAGAAGGTVIEADLNGDSLADFSLQLTASVNMSETDFIL